MSEGNAINQKVELARRMEELKVIGFSSMGKFTQQEQLLHLDQIEQIVTSRQAEARRQGASNPPSPK